jgi:hypothetical protein
MRKIESGILTCAEIDSVIYRKRLVPDGTSRYTCFTRTDQSKMEPIAAT